MSNYSAVVVEIKSIRAHSNADRLACTNIFSNNVIVGKDTKVGDIGIYFPLETQLSKEFCLANDLIRRKDINGKPAGGMFDENRRVRCQTFRGEKSMGFWIPINSIEFACSSPSGIDWPSIGAEFESWNGTPICSKYVPRLNQPSQRGPKEARKPRESRIIDGQFRFHTDTAQLGRNMHKISPMDPIVVTWKLHGTSAIASRALVKRKLNLLERIVSRFIKVQDTEYDYVYASRRVIKNEFESAKQHYYDTDIWSSVGAKHFKDLLHTGETIYYEIVGYTPGGAEIQKGYDYSCAPGECHAYVYRITQTAFDGYVVELQWNQVKERCNEIGVSYVPEIFYGDTSPSFGLDGGDLDKWRDDFLAYLKMRYVYDQDSIFCKNRVPEEGICVRKEGSVIETFKLKSFRFLDHETKQLDKNEVDLETAS